MRRLFLPTLLGALIVLLGLAAGAGAPPASAQSKCPPPQPGLPPVPGCEPTPEPGRGEPEPAQLCLRLAAAPAGGVPPGAIVTYSLAVQNASSRRATGVVLALAYPPAQELLDVRAEQGGAWVSELTPGRIRVTVEQVPGAATAIVTVRLRVGPDAQPGTALADRFAASWDRTSEANPQRSNRVELRVAAAATPATHGQLAVSRQGDRLLLSYDGFASAERVSFWYDRGGRSVPLGSAVADASGRAAFTAPADSLPAGPKTLVAFGQCSQQTAVARLEG